MKDGINAASPRRERTWILLAAVVLCAAGPLPAFEFEYWPKAFVTVPLDQQWQLRFEEWLSFTDNVSRFKSGKLQAAVTNGEFTIEKFTLGGPNQPVGRGGFQGL